MALCGLDIVISVGRPVDAPSSCIAYLFDNYENPAIIVCRISFGHFDSFRFALAIRAVTQNCIFPYIVIVNLNHPSYIPRTVRTRMFSAGVIAMIEATLFFSCNRNVNCHGSAGESAASEASVNKSSY